MVRCVYSEEHLVKTWDPSGRFEMVFGIKMKDVKHLHSLHLEKSCMV